MTIGIDLGDIWSHAQRRRRGRRPGPVRSNPSEWTSASVILDRAGSPWKPERLVWVEQIRELTVRGSRSATCANFRKAIALTRKSDKVDAEKIARYARLDQDLADRTSYRGAAGNADSDTRPGCAGASPDCCGELGTVCVRSTPPRPHLPQAFTSVLPPGLATALGPLLHQFADMTVKIKEYDRAIKQLTETEYPETQALIKVYGVARSAHGSDVRATWAAGTLPRRSRDVGCYLGLRPRRSQSGDSDPQLGITKAGSGCPTVAGRMRPSSSVHGKGAALPCEMGSRPRRGGGSHADDEL